METNSTEVRFTKYGTYKSTATTTLDGMNKREDNNSTAKGTGLLGKLMANFFPQGENVTITKLDEKMIYALNVQKSTYSKSPIEKIEIKKENEKDAKSNAKEAQRYRVLRNELKAVDTGQSIAVNGFPTYIYNVIYIYSVEEIQTKIIKTDSLFVILNLTQSDKLNTYGKEMQEFNAKYMALVGLPSSEKEMEEMLGLNWVTMLHSFNAAAQQNEMKIDYASLSKLKGAPIITEGFYSTYKYDPQASQSNNSEGSSMSGGLGGMMSSAIMKSVKKDNKPAYEEQIYYRTEVLKIDTDASTTDKFTIPAGYKEVKKK
jgi:hypothetical protein